MAREILQYSDKSKADPQTQRYIASEIIGIQGVALIYTSDMKIDGSTHVAVTFSKDLTLGDYFNPDRRIRSGDIIPLTDLDLLVVQCGAASKKIGDKKLELKFSIDQTKTTWIAELRLSAVALYILADFDRDGTVDLKPRQEKKWTWGRSGAGAILLVNSDRDTAHPDQHFRDRLDHRANGPLDLLDMTPIQVVFDGPNGLDLVGYNIRLHVSDAASSRLRIFDVSSEVAETVIEQGIPIATFPPQYRTWMLAVEGLDYPDSAFSGLLTINVTLERVGTQFTEDKLVVRVAPWIALPNTQPAKRVYIAEMEDQSNAATIRDLRLVANAAGVEMIVVPPKINRQDRWLQDEIEIGYASRPGKQLPVVLDSPRNRQLDDFPELMLLGPDFGYVTRGNDEERSSLDSFGNLDCTPPHTGPRGEYPLGRTIFGGAQPGAKKGRRMMKVVSDFLYAQQVQYPIELFSDWLSVGHVDEFMSFVPTQTNKGFKLLLASPKVAIDLFSNLASSGYSSATTFLGKRFEMTIGDLLANVELRKQNERFQEYIDWNKSVLVQEMGLKSEDVIHLPALYFVGGSDGRADAFFPGMVNMQVLNSHLAIPKPFGPTISGECAIERYVRDKLAPLGLTCHFVDTYDGYHLQMGEVHCGTNVVREPFSYDWWEFDTSINSIE